MSHSIVLADGTKKSVGVILPSTLTFNTGVPEIMEGDLDCVVQPLLGEYQAEQLAALAD